MLKQGLGIIGAGSMAEAMLNGIYSERLFLPENIYIINKKNDERLRFFKENFGVQTTRDYTKLVSECKYLVLAVKPQDMKDLLIILKRSLTQEHIIITIAAGITTEFVEKTLGIKIPVIRAMPNTSCQVKESATAISQGQYTTKEAVDLAEEIFSSIGNVYQVKEEMLDVVTGLSGSGPAYVYLLMEAMIKAGTKAGLSASLAEKLTVQTVLGAAKMVSHTGEPPACLREKVTSPGGTTMAGLRALEEMGFAPSVMKAVESATKKSQEMMTEYSEIL